MTKKIEHFVQFNAMNDFLDACAAPLNHPIYWEGKRRSSRDNSSKNNMEWYGGVTFEQASDLARFGWEEGLKHVNLHMNRVLKEVTGRVKTKHIAGAYPDVARFIAGMPDCMNRHYISDSAIRPCLDIVVNVTYSCGIEAKEILNYGAAIASIIDQIESEGYSVALHAGNRVNLRQYGNFGFLQAIKLHGESMELGKMIYAVAHPSYLRRLFFSYQETLTAPNTLTYINSYGTPIDFEKEKQGDIYFPKQHVLNQCKTMAGAHAYVKDIVQKAIPTLIDEEFAA